MVSTHKNTTESLIRGVVKAANLSSWLIGNIPSGGCMEKITLIDITASAIFVFNVLYFFFYYIIGV